MSYLEIIPILAAMQLAMYVCFGLAIIFGIPLVLWYLYEKSKGRSW